VQKWRLPLYAAVNHVSAFFLLLTGVCYLLLWRSQNVHGWLQFSYATSLFLAFNCLGIAQLWSDAIRDYSNKLCEIMGKKKSTTKVREIKAFESVPKRTVLLFVGWLIHWTFLSAFFWLTSMNFDVWWRFR